MDERSKLLDAAEQLFRLYGARSVTMSDIAQHLGMSKKTLYTIVENKNDLVEQTVRRHIDYEKEAVLQIQQRATNALEEMWQVSKMVQRSIQDLNPAMIFDLQRYHHSAWQYFESFRREFVYEMMRSNLQRGLNEGLYRPELDPDFVARMYIACIPIFTDYDIFPKDNYPPQTIHQEYVNYHIHAIATSKGLALWLYFQEQGE